MRSPQCYLRSTFINTEKSVNMLIRFFCGLNPGLLSKSPSGGKAYLMVGDLSGTIS